jgi:hypothetical protein
VRKLAAAAIAASLALVAGVGTGSASAAKPTNVLAASLSLVGPQNGGGEPSIAAARDGTVYVSVPTLDPNETAFYRSSNGGKKWVKGASADSNVGDTSVNVDASGAVYETNLNNVGDVDPSDLQVDVFKSFNKGASWPQKGQGPILPFNSSNMPLFVDRQWLDAWIPPGKTTNEANVYITYHDFVASQIWVNASTDGGRTFGLWTDAITDPTAELASFCSTIPGGLKVVQSGPHAGRVYVAWLAADILNPATGCNLTQAQAFHTVWVAWSDDGGQSWTDQLVFDGGFFHDGSEIFADLALDNRGNPYVAFAMNLQDEFDIWVAASFDGGSTWNGKSDGTGAPIRVNAERGTHYFPTIAAGDPGKVVVGYLATPFVTPTLPNGKPQPVADADADWFVYLAQSVNLRSARPTWHSIKVNKRPMHHGDICTLGLFCSAVPGSNRNLLDFIDVVIDPSGRAHLVYTDDNNYAAGAFVAANQTAGPTAGRGGR